MDMVNQIRAKYNTVIENLLKKYSEELFEMATSSTMTEIEEFVTHKIGSLTKELVQQAISRNNEELRASKKIRKEQGLVLERRDDPREILTQFGAVKYKRDYYQKHDSGYTYPIDKQLDIASYERLTPDVVKTLLEKSKDYSYAKASKEATDGIVSKQTVMNAIRNTTIENKYDERPKKIDVLHIDADEAHVTMKNGVKRMIPLICSYEGVDKSNKRHACINLKKYSQYGLKGDEIWEKFIKKLGKDYDLSSTRVYIHGDGAKWIRTGLEWFNDARFVLDQYHKNKYIKIFGTNMEKTDATKFEREIQTALSSGEIDNLGAIQGEAIDKYPECQETITTAINYLLNNYDGIKIRLYDEEANNGGCTEPHVSHILASRLSTRPMAWSKETLVNFVKILTTDNLQIVPNSMTMVNEVVSNKRKKNKIRYRFTAGLANPDESVSLDFLQKNSGTTGMLKHILCDC